ncbi:WD40 repeat-like protein [Sistotremastrum suecicum HHB10207 ss-3]|uniref:WD40 repeat-like protein n=1 Tax=Sistotremastrum suecicum HHB10207 ss-3 TaxID=1314776 RepID=A0A165X670_9AGAM|nr:WD40 repeat-like protein [Sistotremastrum suecicum HHB10207 ss-3]
MPYTCEQSIRYDSHEILCVAISPCGRFVACGSRDGVAVWDDFEEDPIVIIFPSSVSSLLWTKNQPPSWCLVCGLKNGCVVVIDCDSGKLETFELQSHKSSIAAFTNDAVRGTFASGSESDGCAVWISDLLGKYTLKARFTAREGKAYSYPAARALSFCGNGKYLLGSFADGSLICFSLESETIAWGTHLGVRAIFAELSTAADSILVISSTATVSSYSLKDMRIGSDINVHRRLVPIPGALVFPVAMVHDRNLLFSGSHAGDIQIWDVEHGALADRINLDGGHLIAINALVPEAPSRLVIATVSICDQVVRIRIWKEVQENGMVAARDFTTFNHQS